MSQRKHVVIVGGGVAGLSAAVRLAEVEGLRVTLLETRRKLGGRATSFIDPQTGEQVDNCQHVLMKCCTSLIDLYERLGVMDKIDWFERLHFLTLMQDGAVRHDVLSRDAMPAPGHLSKSLLAFGGLTLKEKMAIGRAMFAMMRLGDQRLSMDDVTFGQWLKTQKQPSSVIDKYWQLVVVSACNEPVERVSCRYAMQVFIEGFLRHRDAYVVGLSREPLLKLYDPAVEAIERCGGEVRLGAAVERLVFDHEQGRITAAALSRGGEVEGDVFISALTADRLAKVCDPTMVARDARLHHLEAIDYTPIVGIHMTVSLSDEQAARGGLLAHLWKRGVRSDLPAVALMGRPLHWVFDKGVTRDAKAGDGSWRQYLHGVISGASELGSWTNEQLTDFMVLELDQVLPDGFGSQAVLSSTAVKEKRATFACVAGVDTWRAGTEAPDGEGIANLLIAGDWSDTGWPATMEGAARSGYRAASAARRLTGYGEPFALPEDLPTSWWLRRVIANQAS